MINVRVNLIARPGKHRELLQSILELKTEIASETGCFACQVYRNTDDTDEFVVFEQWENEELAGAHISSENMAVLVGAGFVLSQHISVSVSKDASIHAMEKRFKQRITRKGSWNEDMQLGKGSSQFERGN